MYKYMTLVYFVALTLLCNCSTIEVVKECTEFPGFKQCKIYANPSEESIQNSLLDSKFNIEVF